MMRRYLTPPGFCCHNTVDRNNAASTSYCTELSPRVSLLLASINSTVEKIDVHERDGGYWLYSSSSSIDTSK